MKDRSSFGFVLWKTTKRVLFPIALLDLLLFAITTRQRGLPSAWATLNELAFPEIVLWLAITFAIFVERRVNNQFAALRDEIEELKERISHLETRADDYPATPRSRINSDVR